MRGCGVAVWWMRGCVVDAWLWGGCVAVGWMRGCEVVVIGQTLRSISSQAGLQLLNILVPLHCLIGHSTTTQTTGESE